MSNVYVIGMSNQPYVKIGVSNNPFDRIVGVQTGSPYKLYLVAYIECIDRASAEKLERLLHQHYAAKRSEGEWFNIHHTAILDDIQQMLDIVECITGIKIVEEVVKQEFHTNVQITHTRKARTKRAIVYTFLDSYPDYRHSGTVRELAAAIESSGLGKVGKDTAEKHRKAYLMSHNGHTVSIE